MKRSRLLVTAIAAAVSAGCTPPRLYREGYEPAPMRSGIADQALPVGTLSGRSGSAAGADGIAFFATQNQMYQAVAELLGGPIVQGVQTYRGLQVSRHATTTNEARAVETLQNRATRAMRQSARAEGDVLVSVSFHAGPREADGSYLLRVESVIESPSGIRHRESRDALVRPRGPGAPYEIRWLGPPRLELRRD